jgi:hypothetical protein
MKLSGIIITAVFVLISRLPAGAEATPLTEPLVEGKEMMVTCELTQPPKRQEVPILKTQQDLNATKGTYHYRLWLPKGYLADQTKRWPCMFIMSPVGNGQMVEMASYLKPRFVVVLLMEAKNGPEPPILGNFLAAHDDVIKRVRIQEGQKFATGLSGGARGSSEFVQARPGFCGLIMQAAGAAYDDSGNYLVNGIRSNPRIYCVMTMGDADSNKGEIAKMKAVMPPTRFKVLEFKGGHAFAPRALFEEAMAWIEQKSTAAPSPAGGGGSKGSSFDDFFKKPAP